MPLGAEIVGRCAGSWLRPVYGPARPQQRRQSTGQRVAAVDGGFGGEAARPGARIGYPAAGNRQLRPDRDRTRGAGGSEGESRGQGRRRRAWADLRRLRQEAPNPDKLAEEPCLRGEHPGPPPMRRAGLENSSGRRRSTCRPGTRRSAASGGEAARASAIGCLLSEASMLLLGPGRSHLDAESSAGRGTVSLCSSSRLVVAVTHDRWASSTARRMDSGTPEAANPQLSLEEQLPPS